MSPIDFKYSSKRWNKDRKKTTRFWLPPPSLKPEKVSPEGSNMPAGAACDQMCDQMHQMDQSWHLPTNYHLLYPGTLSKVKSFLCIISQPKHPLCVNLYRNSNGNLYGNLDGNVNGNLYWNSNEKLNGNLIGNIDMKVSDDVHTWCPKIEQSWCRMFFNNTGFQMETLKVCKREPF